MAYKSRFTLTKPEDVLSLINKGVISWTGIVHIPFLHTYCTLFHMSGLSLTYRRVIFLFTLNKKCQKDPKHIDKCITLNFARTLREGIFHH